MRHRFHREVENRPNREIERQFRPVGPPLTFDHRIYHDSCIYHASNRIFATHVDAAQDFLMLNFWPFVRDFAACDTNRVDTTDRCQPLDRVYKAYCDWLSHFPTLSVLKIIFSV